MNFSFHAILDIYINKIIITPIKIRNKTYEVKYELKLHLHVKDARIICINKINPIDKRCFTSKIIDISIIININIFISENNLIYFIKFKLWKFNLT
ncbi:MAG: hypothetical protein ACEY3K_01390 [Wolbachia sp.]